jgi:hypothetical protein
MKRKKYNRKSIETIDEMYNEFWDIYNSLPNDNFRIRENFKSRIIEKHYKDHTLSRLLIGIKWFVTSFDLNTYYCTYVYLGNKIPYIDIYNLDGDKSSLYEYKILKDEVILVNDFTMRSI